MRKLKILLIALALGIPQSALASFTYVPGNAPEGAPMLEEAAQDVRNGVQVKDPAPLSIPARQEAVKPASKAVQINAQAPAVQTPVQTVTKPVPQITPAQAKQADDLLARARAAAAKRQGNIGDAAVINVRETAKAETVSVSGPNGAVIVETAPGAVESVTVEKPVKPVKAVKPMRANAYKPAPVEDVKIYETAATPAIQPVPAPVVRQMPVGAPPFVIGKGSLKSQLEKYAGQAGFQVSWNYPDDLIVTNETTFSTGSFVGNIRELFETLQQIGKRDLAATLFQGNRTLVVESARR